MILTFAAFAALLTGAPEAGSWTPHQTHLIRLSNAVIESDSWALMNVCKIRDGHARYDIGAGKLKAMLPRLREELGEYPVYEIFVLRAPTINPAALPPARCKSLKSFDPEREALMVRYEGAVSNLEDALADPAPPATTPQ